MRFLLYALFNAVLLFCGKNHSRKRARAQEQQCEHEHIAALVARLRNLRDNGVGFGYFLLAVLIGIILPAILAVPVFGIALFLLRGFLCLDMSQFLVVVRIKLAIGFAADFADCFVLAVRRAALMPAGILANGANAVFELVVGFLNGNGAAAIPLLGVLCFGLFPLFLAGVVLRVQLAIGFAADFANRFFGAGCFAAGTIFSDLKVKPSSVSTVTVTLKSLSSAGYPEDAITAV